MSQDSLHKIAILGNGLAGLLCAAKLVRVLPETIELTYVEAGAPNKTDLLWGNVTTPASYDFLLTLGLSEPDILPNTQTSFSLGTHYRNWGPSQRSWMQSFHRPLPNFNGVQFLHYLTRLKKCSPEMSEYESYIMSIQAAKKHVFAHPPEGKKIPLADVEYGYHFIAEEWRQLLSIKIKESSAAWIKADITDVRYETDKIDAIVLSNGQTIAADFIVDALGANSKLLKTMRAQPFSGRRIKAISRTTQTKTLESVCRTVTATETGWHAKTPLQNSLHEFSICDPGSIEAVLSENKDHGTSSVESQLGHLTTPWLGNCLTLGHGAAILEPLTPAPILLLQRDIDRLVELIPVTENMIVESIEYNRRFKSDYEHAELFNRAHYPIKASGKVSDFWETAMAQPIEEKLKIKIEQFEGRGVTVRYDYEPFSEQDWTMLHMGMGRHPNRYDLLADRYPEDQLKNILTQMKTSIDQMANKMPPHQTYMSGLLKYLKEKHG